MINKSIPLLYDIEKYIIKKINQIDDKYNFQKEELYTKILKSINIKFNFVDSFNENIIKSIRSSYIKNYMILNFKNLKKNNKNIVNDYKNKLDILTISKKYDISPLNALRLIFNKIYDIKLTSIIKKKDLINEYDNNQLLIAIKNDEFALINQNEILNESIKFEKLVENFLNKNNISFKTQEQLMEEQIKLYGKPINTPDFLITSNFYIDNIKINWIDAKNYYGANIYFIKNSIEKQIKKYIKAFGDGCIIFKLGFSEKLNFKNVILLDYNILK